jgi:hypothetical protein
LEQKAGHRSGKCPGFSPDELRVAFSIPSGSLFLVNHPVLLQSLYQSFSVIYLRIKTINNWDWIRHNFHKNNNNSIKMQYIPG